MPSSDQFWDTNHKAKLFLFFLLLVLKIYSLWQKSQEELFGFSTSLYN